MTSTVLPMIPTLSTTFPHSSDWIYEVKYDGYRGILTWDGTSIKLTSRNGKDLNKKFKILHDSLSQLFRENKIPPCSLDGEVCVLKNLYTADFEGLHKGKKEKSSFMAFDILYSERNPVFSNTLEQRKESLHYVMDKLPPNKTIYEVQYYDKADILWNSIKDHNGEGMICKRIGSPYHEGKRTKDWLKVKNWKSAIVFLYAFNPHNGYFHTAVNRSGEIYEVAQFSHGLNSEERTALLEIIKRNKIEEKTGLTFVKPGIVLELEFLDLYKEKLRQPRFHRFCFDMSWEDCTWDNIQSLWKT